MRERTTQIHEVRVDMKLKLSTQELRRLQELTPIDSTVRETLHELIAIAIQERLATSEPVPTKLPSTQSTLPMDHNEMMSRMREHQKKQGES